MSIPENCVSDDPSFEQDVSMLLDGELEASRAQDVRRHLDRCTHCSLLLDAFEGVDRSLRDAALPEVPLTLRRKISEAIEREGAPQPSRFGSRGWARTVLALAASVAIYFAVIGQSSDEIDLEQASEEEIAVARELDTIRDLDVIANLELVERLASIGKGGG
jgi:anti-sigma factor RsiW